MAHRPVRDALDAIRRRLGRVTRFRPGAIQPDDPSPAGPPDAPADWVERVRQGAPGLLIPGGDAIRWRAASPPSDRPGPRPTTGPIDRLGRPSRADDRLLAGGPTTVGPDDPALVADPTATGGPATGPDGPGGEKAPEPRPAGASRLRLGRPAPAPSPSNRPPPRPSVRADRPVGRGLFRAPAARRPPAAIPSTGIPSTGVPSTGVPSTGVPSTGVPSTGVPSAGDSGPGRPRPDDPRPGGPVIGRPGPLVPVAAPAPAPPPFPAPAPPPFPAPAPARPRRPDPGLTVRPAVVRRPADLPAELVADLPGDRPAELAADRPGPGYPVDRPVGREPVPSPVAVAAGPWPPLPGRWPLARPVEEGGLRLDLRRLDDEQRLV